uniref:Uncharacterized protein n=1 Tax=Arundo donax TaxID=35708 RepID=A0A0A9HIG3_ARUDO
MNIIQVYDFVYSSTRMWPVSCTKCPMPPWHGHLRASTGATRPRRSPASRRCVSRCGQP